MSKPSSIPPNLLAEIKGRLRLGDSDIQAKIDQKSKPVKPEWKWPTTNVDDQASAFGMMGFEYKAILAAAEEQKYEPGPVHEAYRRSLMVALMACPDAIKSARIYEERQAIVKNSRNLDYLRRLAAYEEREAQLRFNWQNSREISVGRWLEVGKLLEALLEEIQALEDMSPIDAGLLNILAQYNVVKINKGVVESFNKNAFSNLTVPEINQIVTQLDSQPNTKFYKLHNQS